MSPDREVPGEAPRVPNIVAELDFIHATIDEVQRTAAIDALLGSPTKVGQILDHIENVLRRVYANKDVGKTNSLLTETDDLVSKTYLVVDRAYDIDFPRYHELYEFYDELHRVKNALKAQLVRHERLDREKEFKPDSSVSDAVNKIKQVLYRLSNERVYQRIEGRDLIEDAFAGVERDINSSLAKGELTSPESEQLIREVKIANYSTRKKEIFKRIENEEKVARRDKFGLNKIFGDIENELLIPMKNIALELERDHLRDYKETAQKVEDTRIILGAIQELFSIIGTTHSLGDGGQVSMRRWPTSYDDFTTQIDPAFLQRMKDQVLGTKRIELLNKAKPGAPIEEIEVDVTLVSVLSKKIIEILSGGSGGVVRFPYLGGANYDQIIMFDSRNSNIDGTNVHAHLDELVKILYGSLLCLYPEQSLSIPEAEVARLAIFLMVTGLFPSVLSNGRSTTIADQLLYTFFPVEKTVADIMAGRQKGRSLFPAMLIFGKDGLQFGLSALFNYTKVEKNFIKKLKEKRLLGDGYNPEDDGEKFEVEVDTQYGKERRLANGYSGVGARGPAAGLFRPPLGLFDPLLTGGTPTAYPLPANYLPITNDDGSTLFAQVDQRPLAPGVYEGLASLYNSDLIDSDGNLITELFQIPGASTEYYGALASQPNGSIYEYFQLRDKTEVGFDSFLSMSEAGMVELITNPSTKGWGELKSRIVYYLPNTSIGKLAYVPPERLIPEEEYNRIMAISDPSERNRELKIAKENGNIIRKRIEAEVVNSVLLWTILMFVYVKINSNPWEDAYLAQKAVEKLFNSNPDLFERVPEDPYSNQAYRDPRTNPTSLFGRIRNSIVGSPMSPDLTQASAQKIVETYAEVFYSSGLGLRTALSKLTEDVVRSTKWN